MTGILFATSEEAMPFLDQYSDRRFDGLDEGDHIWIDDVLVTVSGQGKIKATLVTERLLQQQDVDVLVHAGGAVALTEDLETGTPVGVTFVLEGDRVDLDAPSYPRMPLTPLSDSLAEGTLVTQDHTNENGDEPRYWERIADLRDTTGYAVAYVAAQHGTACHIVKGIVDPEETESNGPDPAYNAVATCIQEQLTANLKGQS